MIPAIFSARRSGLLHADYQVDFAHNAISGDEVGSKKAHREEAPLSYMENQRCLLFLFLSVAGLDACVPEPERERLDVAFDASDPFGREAVRDERHAQVGTSGCGAFPYGFCGRSRQIPGDLQDSGGCRAWTRLPLRGQCRTGRAEAGVTGFPFQPVGVDRRVT